MHVPENLKLTGDVTRAALATQVGEVDQPESVLCGLEGEAAGKARRRQDGRRRATEIQVTVLQLLIVCWRVTIQRLSTAA